MEIYEVNQKKLRIWTLRAVRDSNTSNIDDDTTKHLQSLSFLLIITVFSITIHFPH